MRLVILTNTIDETNFRPKLLLTDKQVKSFCNVLGNNSVPPTRFLGKLHEPLMKIGLPLTKSIFDAIRINHNSSSSSRCKNS